MKRRLLYGSLFLFTFLLIGAFMCEECCVWAEGKEAYKKAGMNVYPAKPGKTHTVEAKMHLPFVGGSYHHPATAHRDKSGGIKSVIIEKPFTCMHQGVKVTVKSAVHQSGNDTFVGHGKIHTPHIQGKEMYAGHIEFNHKGITRIDKLSHRGFSFKVKGHVFTPEELKWKRGRIEADGLLSRGKRSLAVTLHVSGSGAKVAKLNGKVDCLIGSRPAVIERINFKGGKILASGKATLYNGEEFEFKDVEMDKAGNLSVSLPQSKKPESYAEFEKKAVREIEEIRKERLERDKKRKEAKNAMIRALISDIIDTAQGRFDTVFMPVIFQERYAGENPAVLFNSSASALPFLPVEEEEYREPAITLADRDEGEGGGESPVSTLPGMTVLPIDKTDMNINITSSLHQGEIISSYISMPDPIGRANVFSGKCEGKQVNVDDAGMFWQKEKIRVPHTKSDITLKYPVKMIYNDEGENGHLSAYTSGDIAIREVTAPSFLALADNDEIDYRVKSSDISPIFDSITGCVPFKIEAPDIHFDVIQGRTFVGYVFNALTGDFDPKPKVSDPRDVLNGKAGIAKQANAGVSNAAWLGIGHYEGPSVILKSFSNGYLHLYFNGGTELDVPIIPGVINAEEIIYEFTRDPYLYTELLAGATFVPAEPPLKKLGVKTVGKVSIDKVGMYTQTGQKNDFYVFYEKVGQVIFGYNSYNKKFIYEGDVSIKGLPFCYDCTFMSRFKGGDPFIEGGGHARLKMPKWVHKLVKVMKHVPVIGWVTKHVWKWVKEMVWEVCAINWWINRDGNVGFKIGGKSFTVPEGSPVGSFEGPIPLDGLTYYGKMEIDIKEGIATIEGTTHNLTGHSGNDNVSGKLTMDDVKESEAGIINGGLSGTFNINLNPCISGGDISISLPGTRFNFFQDPDTGWWTAVSQKPAVTFSYTDDKGSQQQYSGSCQLRAVLEHNQLMTYLDLPAQFGGTYKQRFVLDE